MPLASAWQTLVGLEAGALSDLEFNRVAQVLAVLGLDLDPPQPDGARPEAGPVDSGEERQRELRPRGTARHARPRAGERQRAEGLRGPVCAIWRRRCCSRERGAVVGSTQLFTDMYAIVIRLLGESSCHPHPPLF